VEPPLISHTNAIDAIWLETLAAPTVAQSFKTNAPAVSRANHHKLLFWRRGGIRTHGRDCSQRRFSSLTLLTLSRVL